MEFPPPCRDGNDSITSSALSPMGVKLPSSFLSSSHRRALLRKESEISEWGRRIRELGTQLSEEAERLQAASVEFSYLQRVRQASVALNVWQPEVVCGRQKQMVEQSTVPVEGRVLLRWSFHHGDYVMQTANHGCE